MQSTLPLRRAGCYAESRFTETILKADRATSKAAALARDRERVVAIVRSYPVLYLAGKRITGPLNSKVDADDVIQNIFVILFRRVEPADVFRMHDAGELTRWLQTVIRNQANEVVRALTARRRHDGQHTFGESEQFDAMAPALFEGVPDDARSPSSAEALVEAKEAMLAALETLPPMERRALRLALAGHTPPQIAQHMYHPEGVIRGLLYRGRQALRARMGPADQWFSGANSEDRLADVLGLSANPNGM